MRAQPFGKKHVLFGEVQVIDHPRWIDPVQDVYVDPPSELVERGQAPPNLSSHDASYWPNWALRHSRQLDIHLAGLCGDKNCAWNSIAEYRRWLPLWSNAQVFCSWSLVALTLNKR